MSDTESKDLDRHFQELRRSFQTRAKKPSEEVREGFEARKEEAAKKFKAKRVEARSDHALAAKEAEADAEALRQRYRDRASEFEGEAMSLQGAHRRIEKIHERAAKQELLDKAGFTNNE